MNFHVIKLLVENQTLLELREAEEALLDERQPDFEVEGCDESEQLTHVFAAIWVLNYCRARNVDHALAIREFTKRISVVA